MKLCITVTNSLRKDPRVIKQVEIAQQNGIEVSFVGMMDEHYSKDFLDRLHIKWTLISRKEKYKKRLKNPVSKLMRNRDEERRLSDAIIAYKPDVIHANDFSTLPQAYRAAIKCGAGLIYDSHEIYAENSGIVERKWFQRLIIRQERKLVHRVDKMICVSNAASVYFAKTYGIEPPTVITNCPMKSVYPLREKAARFEVETHGRFYDGRGYEEMIEAAKYADPSIVFVLRGFGATEEKLRGIIRENHLENRVRIDPPVEVAELIAAASSSHIGTVLTRPINLNFSMSVSNKVFEFVHAGLPVILSDIPEHRYLNDKYHFGIIIDEVTPEKIAAAADTLFHDKELYETLHQNALHMAEEMCWENESRRLLEIYRGIAENHAK